MRSMRLLGILGAFTLMACGPGSTATQEQADIVYTNGRIYTVNDAQPWAEAVAIKDVDYLNFLAGIAPVDWTAISFWDVPHGASLSCRVRKKTRLSDPSHFTIAKS